MKAPSDTLTGKNGSEEVADWIFSLIPAGVVYIFYVVFIMQANLENSHLYLAFGAAAGFIGLEAYWILKGWRNHRRSTVVMGLAGIACALGAIELYLSIVP